MPPDPFPKEIYVEVDSRELQDESGNGLLDESGNLLIGDFVDTWAVVGPIDKVGE